MVNIMQNIKLIAVDLDGTLLNDDNELSVENKRAINELNKRNIFFTPCTGRSLSEIPLSVIDNPDIRYIIYSNGSVVFDKVTKTTIKNCISNDTAVKIFNILAKFNNLLTIRQSGNCYIKLGSTDDFFIDFYNVISSHQDVMKNYATQIKDFSFWKYQLTDIEVISAFFHDLNDKEAVKKELSQIEDIIFVEASEFNFEIISKNAGKGSGVENLVNLLNIKKEQVMAIGDSGNDIPMMNVAGIRLAVSNATDQLKSFCDKVICSNNEHAVQFLLNNFIVKN